MDNFIISNKVEFFGEHISNSYILSIKSIPKETLYFKFIKRRNMEEFIYRHGVENYTYKSSNGNIINKVWKCIPEKYEKEKKWYKKIEKYSFEDFYCGHFIGRK